VGNNSVSFTGFWLGLLKREYLHLIDEIYYDTSKMYYKEEYNKQGLWNWEKRMIDKYFYACNKLLIIGVGGGREVLALHKSGYDVDGFECNPKMVEYANTLLEAEGITQKVQVCSRDIRQYGMKVYDGIIVGWGAYMSFLGKEERINLLRNLRNQVKENSPILLSFFCRTDAAWRFKAVSKIGNAIRWILRRNYLENWRLSEP